MEALDRAIELEPENAEYYYARGLLYYHRFQGDDAEKALADFDLALALGTQPAMVYYRKAQIHGSLQNVTLDGFGSFDPAQALEEIDSAIEMEPGQAIFYEERAVISNVSAAFFEQSLGKAYPSKTFLSVVSDLKKAIDIDPYEARYYEYLATVLVNHSQHNLSLDYYSLYINLLKTKWREVIEGKGTLDLNCRERQVKQSLIDAYGERAIIWEKSGDHRRAYDDRLAACELQDWEITECLRPR